MAHIFNEALKLILKNSPQTLPFFLSRNCQYSRQNLYSTYDVERIRYFLSNSSVCSPLHHKTNLCTLTEVQMDCTSRGLYFSQKLLCSVRTFFRSFALRKSSNGGQGNEIDDLVSLNEAEEKIFEEWSRELLPVAGLHAVFVIQPYLKWGPGKKQETTPELQLEEAVALVHSLHGWRVVDKTMIGLMSFKKKIFFGSGNFDSLSKKIRSEDRITAVFISTKMLSGVQHRELQLAFGVPVFDRYTLIIHLFRQHAVSKVAKLQVAIAEIPYLWTQLKNREYNIDKRGSGETTVDFHKQILANRESKLKQELQKLRSHRKLLRSKRQKLEYPIVAVVGYTNSGKTSLIKALTGDENLQPKNQLFATLDVSNHMGLLPSRLKVLYVDTIGFISDIPTLLLEPFIATLEDALVADVIVHVTDASHPDREAQVQNVTNTLQSLELSNEVLNNIIVIGNKIDLVKDKCYPIQDIGIPVSATALTGLHLLKRRIEEIVLQTTGRTSLIVRVPMGSKEASWLYKEATVTDVEADPKNSQYLLMHVIITHAQLSKFQHHFVKNNNSGS